MEQKRAFTSTEWTNITTSVNKLFKDCDIVADGSGHNKPEVNDDFISFNGLDNENDDSHETFYIQKTLLTEFNFCKTARKPYDKYVVAVLTICNHYAKNALDIGSDGNIEEWYGGMTLAQDIIGETVNAPLRVTKE